MRAATGLVVAVVVFLCAPGALGDVNEEWVRRYEGPGGGHDYARAIAMDDSGNVYAAGSSSVGLYTDFTVVKYDPDGVRRWVATYDGPGGSYDDAQDIVFRDGYAYVAGSSIGTTTDRDYVTIRYTRGGTEDWVARYNGSADGRDEAKAIAVDDSGNVYVTGVSDGGASGYDMLTVKYTPAGDAQWERRYVGTPGNYGLGFDLALDDQANVYVTGRADSTGADWDLVTVKYSRGGVLEWAVGQDGPSDEDYDGGTVAVTPDGYPVISIASWRDVTSDDYLTIRYTPGGAEDWRAWYDGAGGEDHPNGVAVDDSGCVYVTGKSSFDYLTVKYGPDGAERWTARYDGPVNEFDEGDVIALDGDANVYVTGESTITAARFDRDIVTIRYGQGGSEDWVAEYGGPASAADVGWGIVAGDDGSVYVCGMDRQVPSYSDMITIKYSQDDPVEGYLWASVTEAGNVLLSWSVPALTGVGELNVYRATSPDGPFVRVNGAPLDPVSPGEFEDSTVWPETTFWYELRAVLDDGSEDVVEPGPARVTTGGALTLGLCSPRPNPSSGVTALWFEVPSDGPDAKLTVYNLRGELVKALIDGAVGRGRHVRHWDGTDETGHVLAAGVYFVRLEAAGATSIRKVLLVR